MCLCSSSVKGWCLIRSVLNSFSPRIFGAVPQNSASSGNSMAQQGTAICWRWLWVDTPRHTGHDPWVKRNRFLERGVNLSCFGEGG